MKNKLRFSVFTKFGICHRGFAWIALCISLALHVTDESLNDFLSVYNPAVLYPGIAHVYTPEMWEETLKWLGKNL